MSEKSIKALGILVTIIGFGLTLITGWVEDKKMNDKIDERVKKAIADAIK